MQTQITQQLREMRLTGLLNAFEEQQHNTQFQELSFEERFAFIIDKEYILRKNRALARNLKQAKLKQLASMEDIDFEPRRGIKRAEILELSHCNWIAQKLNLALTGLTGVGKSFIACALADKACKLGYRALYTKTPALITQLLLARADGSYPKLAARLQKTHVLILDEWLRDPLSPEHAREILDLLDDRYQHASIIFASQLPMDKWHLNIQDPTIADAVLDRIFHNSLKIPLKGETMRKRHNKLPATT